jgi:hypothetical protein
MSIVRDSQGIGSCVLEQVRGNKMFPWGEEVSLLEPNNCRVKQSLRQQKRCQVEA